MEPIWSGEFIDENGERIITFSLNEYFSESGGHRMPSGWKYTFSPKVQPIELLIAAGTTCIPCLDGEAGAIMPSITSNIYISMTNWFGPKQTIAETAPQPT